MRSSVAAGQVTKARIQGQLSPPSTSGFFPPTKPTEYDVRPGPSVSSGERLQPIRLRQRRQVQQLLNAPSVLRLDDRSARRTLFVIVVETSTAPFNRCRRIPTMHRLWRSLNRRPSSTATSPRPDLDVPQSCHSIKPAPGRWPFTGKTFAMSRSGRHRILLLASSTIGMQRDSTNPAD